MPRLHAPGYLSVLRRHRDLRLLFAGLATSAAGSWAYNVALIVYAYQETHSALWVSLATIGRFIPLLLFQAYAGVLAERFERVRLMVSADIACTVLMSVVTVLAIVHAHVLALILVAALNSVIASMYPPAVEAMLPQVAGEDDLAAANALNATVENLAVIFGPAAAGLILLVGSPPVAFAVNAATFAVSALCVSRVRARSTPTDVTEEGGTLRQILNGFKAITSSTTAAVLVAFSVLASFVYGTDTVALVYVSREQLGTGADGIGYLLAALGLGGVLGALLIERLASSPRLGRVIVIGMAVYCVPTAVLIFTSSPVVASAVQVVRGAGTMVVDTLAVTALQRSLPRDMVARVFGAFFTLVLVAITLGSFLTSQLLNAVSLDAALLVLAFAVPLATVLAWPWVGRIDKIALARLEELAPRIAALEGLQIFAAARRPTLERLAAAATPVEVAARTAIVTEGEDADALYVIVSGQVTVTQQAGERPRPLRDMGAGEYFGEIGLLERIPRTATVTATEPTSLYRISGPEFLEALSSAHASTGLIESTRSRLARSHPTYEPTFVALPEQRETTVERAAEEVR